MAYCTQADIEHLLSEEGVNLSADDIGCATSVEVAAIVTTCIARATMRVKQYFTRRYDTGTLDGIVFVTWATATVAARLLLGRRGNTVPDQIEEEYQWFLDQLEGIRSGSQLLDGVAPTAQAGIGMVNFRFDQRFRRVKSRVEVSASVPRTSRRPRRGDYNFLIVE